MAYTKGPWRVETLTDTSKFNLPHNKPIYQILTDQFEYTATVATVEEYCEVSEEIDREADANLIAAAPDLFESLLELVKLLENKGAILGPELNRAKAAIARARSKDKRARLIEAAPELLATLEMAEKVITEVATNGKQNLTRPLKAIRGMIAKVKGE